MKKLLGIVVLGLFFMSNVFADIYFCNDLDGTGFKGLKDNRKQTNYEMLRFKAKITFDPPSFSSTDLSANLKCQTISIEKFSMSCSDAFGEIFTIDASAGSSLFFKFNRAKTYGRNDDLVIYHGTCENF
jgi:hypothetical protein